LTGQQASLHNHFVPNSVSFADGYKFYDSERFYRRMQRESDKLCREYELSVIDDPQTGKTKHHAEIQAEREGKPTWRGLLKTEIDEAISQSMTENQLVMNLKKRGYRVKLRGRDIFVCPPSKPDIAQNYCRLGKNFGAAYYREGLMKQMWTQGRPKFPEPEPKKTVRTAKLKGNLQTAKKLTGFRALYFHYLYLLGKLPKNNPRPKDEATVTEVKAQISLLSARMGEIRKEVVLCDDIAARSLQIKEKMARVRQEQEQNQQTKGKEKNRHEHIR
jgi:hypothetical protein